MKIKSILVSQPQPTDITKTPYGDMMCFAIGALILKEKNLKAKAVDLALLLLSMALLYLGCI